MSAARSRTPDFGRAVFDTTQDPALFNGWGVPAGRLEHRRVGAAAGAAARVGGSRLLPPLAHEFRRDRQPGAAAADFGTFSIRRRPIRGCRTAAVRRFRPLYNVNQNVASLGRSTTSSRWRATTATSTSRRTGCSINVSARPGNGLFFQGGFNTGKTVSDNCEIRAAIPELAVDGSATRPDQPATATTSMPGCVTRCTGLGVVHDSEVDVQIARDDPQRSGRRARGELGRAELRDSAVLGRPLSNSAPTSTVNLIQPGDDVRRSRQRDRYPVREDPAIRPDADQRRRGHLQHHQMRAGADLQPELRVPTRLTGGAWLTPTSVLQPRFFKFSATIDF